MMPVGRMLWRGWDLTVAAGNAGPDYLRVECGLADDPRILARRSITVHPVRTISGNPPLVRKLTIACTNGIMTPLPATPR